MWSLITLLVLVGDSNRDKSRTFNPGLEPPTGINEVVPVGGSNRGLKQPLIVSVGTTNRD